MTVDALKYKPSSISQRDVLLADDGVDDCRAVAATYLAAAATTGEIFVHPNGNPMGRRNRVALVKRARKSLGPALATGPLNTTHTSLMLRYLVPEAPFLSPADLSFRELRELLRNGYSASLSGNPAHIKGPSPLHRVGDVGHEYFLWGEVDDEIVVGDPYLPFRPRFGEKRPAAEVRQFAYKDSDSDLTAVFVIRRGQWSWAEMVKRSMGADLTRVRTQRNTAREGLAEANAALITTRAQLKAALDDGDSAGRTALLDQVEEGFSDLMATLRSED